MTQICPRKVAAGVAAASRIRRGAVFRVPRVLDDKGTPRREQLPATRVTSRQDAVEHVNAARHALEQIVGHTGTHEVTRTLIRQQRSRVRDDVVHDICRFTNAQTAYRVRVEADLDSTADAL